MTIAESKQAENVIEYVLYMWNMEQLHRSLGFNIEGIHPYDIGTIVDKLGIAVRTGHHCAQPIMDFYKIPGTIRASFAFYNTKEEINRLIEVLGCNQFS